jgi:hypothetical protein
MTDALWTESKIEERLGHIAVQTVHRTDAKALLLEMQQAYEAENAKLTAATLDLVHEAEMLEAKLDKRNAELADLETHIDSLERALFRATHPADVSLTVGATPYATSQFTMGIQDVDASLRAGSQIARDRLAAVNDVWVTHISNFGISQAWPTESTGKPTNWSSLDARLNMFVQMGVEIAVIDHGWPMWMKELVDGSGVRNYTAADPATGGRPRWDKEAQFRTYHYEIAKHTMAAPYNVRMRLFSNELKGFVMRKDGKKGYDHEEHTKWYNIWVEEVERAAKDLGIDPASLTLCGSYPPVRTNGVASSDTVPVGHMLYGKPYGEYRKAPLEALEYFVKNAKRFDVLCWDAGTGNPEGGEKVDAFTVAMTKWADMMAWANTLTSKHKLITETYTKTADDNNADIYRLCAAKTVSYLSIIESGYIGAWPWGPIGHGEDSPNAGLITGYGATDTTLPFYDAYKLIGDHFSAGASLYPVTIEGEGVYAKASGSVVIAVNMTSAPLTVCVGETVVELGAYQVAKVER